MREIQDKFQNCSLNREEIDLMRFRHQNKKKIDKIIEKSIDENDRINLFLYYKGMSQPYTTPSGVTGYPVYYSEYSLECKGKNKYKTLDDTSIILPRDLIVVLEIKHSFNIINLLFGGASSVVQNIPILQLQTYNVMSPTTENTLNLRRIVAFYNVTGSYFSYNLKQNDMDYVIIGFSYEYLQYHIKLQDASHKEIGVSAFSAGSNGTLGDSSIKLPDPLTIKEGGL